MIESLLEKNQLPDFLIRFGMRRLLSQKLDQENSGREEAQKKRFNDFVKTLMKSPITVHTQDANRQHYELPTEFFKFILGRHMKYSGGYWRPPTKFPGSQPAYREPNPHAKLSGLDLSEKDMLEMSIERAEIYNGMNILELGCGWGSMCLYLAEHFPDCRITALSNSSTQREYIQDKALKKKLTNLTVLTADIAEFESDQTFDRVVSVEMFEHVRNYQLLFQKISRWLRPEGKLFVHIFCHKRFAYAYDHTDPSDWIAQHFFTGGIMPSENLFAEFSEHLKIQYHWRVDGTHYQKTCRAWLKNMDRHKKEIWPILEKTYGKDDALKWWVRWRVFFMACEELFGFKRGSEWFVGHYLFVKK